MKDPKRLNGQQTEPTNWEMDSKPWEQDDNANALARVYRNDFESTFDYGGEEKHLRDYWRVVRKHILLVIGVTMLVTGLTAVYMARKPDIYQAQARIQVDFDGMAGTGAPGSTLLFNGQGSDLMYFNTQLQILSGPGLMRRVVKTLDLAHNRNFIAPMTVQGRSTTDNLKRMIGMEVKDGKKENARAENDVPVSSTVAGASLRDDMYEAKQFAPFVNALQGGFTAEPVRDRRMPVKETRLIDLNFFHPDPQIAAKVVNTVADTFVLQNMERKQGANTSTSEFLSKRIAELQEQIRSSEERLLNYSRDHQILTLQPGQDIVVQRLGALNSELIGAQNELKSAEASYKANTTPQAINAQAETSDPKINGLVSRLNDLKLRRDQILSEGTEELPEYVPIKQSIETTEKQLAEARKQASSLIVTNYETRYRQAQARVQSLQIAYDKQRGETATQNEAAINYRIISQEIDTFKGLLNGLLQQAKQNDVVLAGMPNNVHVVDYAVLPDAPVGPRRMNGVVIAFLLSLGASLGFTFFLNYLDDSMNTAEEVERATALPALAVIPSVHRFSARQLLPRSFGVKQLKGRGGDSNAQEPADPAMLLQGNKNVFLAEAYKQLRTSLLLSMPGQPPRTVLVTSSQPAEGKTTTSVNLAITLAQTGAKVLLVDADMRHPRHHRIFGVGNDRGLSEILASQMSEVEMLAMIDQHADSGVYLLPSGNIPPNPAELLGSEQMLRLLAAMKNTFTHIIIDSPPMAVFTDSVLLASIVEGVLLVVHSGKCSRGQVRRTKRVLQDVSVRLIGVILNQAKLTPQHDYHRYYNGY